MTVKKSPSTSLPNRWGATDQPFEVFAYTRMYRIRRFEEASLELSQRKPPVAAGSMHLCAGQEAIPVGALAALRQTDQIIATYRGHGWALESGIEESALLAEICHRDSGLNGGRAGSAYLMAPNRRFIGENSIVGAGGPLAAGVALAAVHARDGNVVLVSFGDGAMSQGALHESMVFAAARDLPVIFLCENNGWSEMTSTSSLLKIGNLARRANGYGFPGATIDGTDPQAVHDTIALASERARQGDGPSLIECRAPRLWGHYNNDIEHYRSKADRNEAAENDPLDQLQKRILADGLLDEAELAEMRDSIDRRIADLVQATIELPTPEPDTATRHIYADALPTSRVPAPTNEPITATYAQAVNQALRDELTDRDNVILYGEDVGHAGGIFGVSRNLQREFGELRVFDTPIAEAAILGSAVGAAIRGLRPIVEIMWADFLLVALDQLINQAANIRYVTGGAASVPIVVRTQQGATPGSCAQHSQSLEALLAHIPGLRVGVPATPQDAYEMLRCAVADEDPVILFESRALYQTKAELSVGPCRGPAAGAQLRASGHDAVIITWGTMVAPAIEAAAKLEDEGIDVAVLDLRWLCPLDDDAIASIVRKTGRVIIAHEANLTGGFGAEIAARIAESHMAFLKGPIARVGAPDVRMPAAPALQSMLLPNATSIEKAVRSLMMSTLSTKET